MLLLDGNVDVARLIESVVVFGGDDRRKRRRGRNEGVGREDERTEVEAYRDEREREGE